MIIKQYIYYKQYIYCTVSVLIINFVNSTVSCKILCSRLKFNHYCVKRHNFTNSEYNNVWNSWAQSWSRICDNKILLSSEPVFSYMWSTIQVP